MDLKEKPLDNHHRHPWELARAKVASSLIKRQLDNLSNKNILDLGCGDLFFLKDISKNTHNSNFYAVDIAFQEDDLTKDYGASFKAFKSMDDLPKDNNLVFDVVFIMDVVEHINDDLGFLQNLHRSPYITHNTIILITVPAFQNLFSAHDIFLGHYRRYNNESLKKLICKAGYKPIDKGYFFTSLLFPRFLQSTKEKLLKPTKESNGTGLTHWNQSSFISKGVADILYLDYKIQKIARKIGIQLPGLSNYILCKKFV